MFNSFYPFELAKQVTRVHTIVSGGRQREVFQEMIHITRRDTGKIDGVNSFPLVTLPPVN